MQFPFWQLPYLSSGLVIATIAIIHVFIAHFAVGGGLFLVLTERMARKADSATMLEYTRRHAKFFLIASMVFGGVTGVGIWFTVALASPDAITTLLHTFVFGWATEWVFFLCEIIALLVYYYKFKTMNARDHMRVGWLYFLFAWLSLFMINGIIGFMLTPGEWLRTGDFWHGFFNPTFWPSLFFRSFLACTLAGLFAFVTASRMPAGDDEAREARTRLVRWASLWVAVPFVLLMASGWWYLAALPPEQNALALRRTLDIAPFLKTFLIVSPIVMIGGILFGWATPQRLRFSMACLLLTLGLIQIGSFEWVRESARRPWVIFGHTYSNAVRAADVEKVNKNGFAASTPWIIDEPITEANRIDVGKRIFNYQCITCHSVGGLMLSIKPRTEKFGSPMAMAAQLDGQGVLRGYMPPFMGSDEERLAVATYISYGIHGMSEPEKPAKPEPLETPIPEWDRDTAEYALLAWNNLGMHCLSDSDAYWILLPPANDIYAQLIRRGDSPEVVTEGVRLTYEVEEGFENPSKHVRFWEFAKSLLGKELPPDVGVSGKGMKGDMDLHEEQGAFAAAFIPVVPYPDSGGFNPYPIFTIRAFDAESGELLAETRTVAPTSTEMGCKNCHGGEWRVPVRPGTPVAAGFTDSTSAGVLEAHDRINGTSLLAEANAGNPKLCQSCHADPVLGTEGRPDTPSFPAAIHGWHANYLTGRGADACATCHPAGAESVTKCMRGLHADRGLDCTSCHGTLEDHALSLIKGDLEAGRESAANLLGKLQPRTVETIEEINPRVPWLMEPDCLSCHDHETLPERDASAFNLWTDGDPASLYRLRHEDFGQIMCQACHGSTHAIYPARNDYGINRDNIGPMQYQGSPRNIGAGGRCFVCHTDDSLTLDDFLHHGLAAKE